MVKARIPDKEKEIMLRQQYGIAGEHSAVKLCTWTKRSLRDEGVCYKEKFYGIQCHRCLQCTPIVSWCSHNCQFCWRIGDFKLPTDNLEWDAPEEILEKMIERQRFLMNGFPGNPKCNSEKFKEAQEPRHAAISLAGEPMAFPKMNGFLRAIHKRGMTSFIVTNGTYPENIEKLEVMPTQMYLTLPAPDKETYLETCKPMLKEGWEKILRTLEMFPKLDTRKVIRLTLVKGLNMHSPEKYAELVRIAQPHFLEAKAYMCVGGSRSRLKYEDMPSHEEIIEFSKKLAQALDWKIIDEKEDSRVCLIAKHDYDWRKMKFD